jgi:hypothetical protein
MLAGNLMAGWQLAQSLVVAQTALAANDCGDFGPAFMQAKVSTARFYADHILSRAPQVADAIVNGANSIMALAPDAF